MSSKLDDMFAISKSESKSAIFPDSISDSIPKSIAGSTSALTVSSIQLSSRSSGNKESSSALLVLAIAEESVAEPSVVKSVENSPKSSSILDSSLLGLLIFAPS